jgi:hypothetical protein
MLNLFESMFTFSKKYFILAVLLLLIEVLIALYIHDAIIRPYIGDVLVVILIYCFLKSFFRVASLLLAISVFLFACLIEALQYINIVNRLGLQQYRLVRIIIGTSFAWNDILAYATGIVIVLLLEKLAFSKKISIFPKWK